METVETLIIGGGQAGLAISFHLSRLQRPHLILERGRVGERWRSERWDGLHFQTPNALVRLPGLDFPHADPDAFATAAQIADYLEGYAAAIPAPVRCGVAATALRAADGGGFVAQTGAGSIWAANVVAATGPYQRPIFPDFLAETPDILQLHSSQYRAPSGLPDGAVLVVGAGASGAQIADELMQAGRQVYFSVSRHRRAPRRYRGRDHVWWWGEIGMLDTPPDPGGARPPPVVHSGVNGGRTIDFRDFARKGMVLLGRATAVRDGVMDFAPDLADNLAHGDAACIAFMDRVDDHIRRAGLDLPPDPEARHLAAMPAVVAQTPRELDLRAANIRSVIWATGYGLDFSWIDIPVFDDRGRPPHREGVSMTPGLYFLGLPFLSRFASSFLFGVGADAERLAAHIDSRAGR